GLARLRSALRAVGPQARVPLDAPGRFCDRAHHVLWAADLRTVALRAAAVWLPDTGAARGLCHLFSGIVPHPLARNRRRLLLQCRPDRCGEHAFLLRLAERADGVAPGHHAARPAFPPGPDRDSLPARDQRPAVAGVTR